MNQPGHSLKLDTDFSSGTWSLTHDALQQPGYVFS